MSAMWTEENGAVMEYVLDDVRHHLGQLSNNVQYELTTEVHEEGPIRLLYAVLHVMADTAAVRLSRYALSFCNHALSTDIPFSLW